MGAESFSMLTGSCVALEDSGCYCCCCTFVLFPVQRTGLRRPPSRRYPRVFDIGIDSASTSSFRLGHLRLDHSFKRPATTTSVTDRH
ncbi:Os06g0277600 [Oryza sativa Japonica Group]|uniref:Os06g0277600 protein n=1 Tax=Oryza sativa subsp. japonica TaxID=39947 RepID=Q0DCX3_ORYSJ|nr:Os06g0277600 [Oryza sativa Japonica Group]|eukprot:NP_001057386.1 Os06g0277600 [Oryza sativa Japonica Group]